MPRTSAFYTRRAQKSLVQSSGIPHFAKNERTWLARHSLQGQFRSGAALKAYSNGGSSIRNQPRLAISRSASPFAVAKQLRGRRSLPLLPCSPSRIISPDRALPHLQCAHRKIHPGQVHPGRQHPQNHKPESLLPDGCQRRRLFPDRGSGHATPHPSTHRTLRGSGWLRRKRSNLFILGRRSALSAPGVVLDQSRLGKQPRLPRRLCRFRARHHSPLPGVSRNLLSGASSANQPLQQHGFFPGHPVRKMSWPGKGTRGAREVEAAIPHRHPEPGAILPRPANGSVRLVPRRPRPAAAALVLVPSRRAAGQVHSISPRPLPTRRSMCMATRSTC